MQKRRVRFSESAAVLLSPLGGAFVGGRRFRGLDSDGGDIVGVGLDFVLVGQLLPVLRS